MLVREVRPEEKDSYNQAVAHPLQSWEWGEFRAKTGIDVVRLGEFNGSKIVNGFTITFHPVPKFPFTIGYLPKSVLPSEEVLAALKDLGKAKNAIFIKLEPNVYQIAETDNKEKLAEAKTYLKEHSCVFGKPMFTKYSFMANLRLSEQELLANMKQKTRYNVGLAQRKGVEISEDNSESAFEDYLKLTFEETTKRQRFYAHNEKYHRQMWSVLKPAGIAHLLKATHQGNTLVTWILFTFNQILYYPYGASSSADREVMASNLMMWEAIRYGKQAGCQIFDMWGSLGPDPDPKDPWMGFHKFKQGYGPTLMEFMGTFDYVIDQPKYQVYQIADKARWKLLKLKAALPL
ncbi:peptidoglycan bridge formation glycyltransferase FemA/FemB family protein [Candidatus Beckwithbacteria bacterium]|nr:peptidoglycan bridge formation glycyltransferase FemA/FemB family protein [Candidatus Beckwithbacteria bacterium]